MQSKNLILTLTLICSIFFYESQAQTWNYTFFGSNWTQGVCSSGQAQSPIDLTVLKGACDSSMVFNLQWPSIPVMTTIFRNETTIWGEGAFGQLYATDIDGKFFGYEAYQISFKTPSEHKIDGKGYDLEMQIFYKIQNEFTVGKNPIAVVSFLFQQSTTNANNTLFLTDFTSVDSNQVSLTIDFKTNFATQLPSPIKYYSYSGSMTQPDCQEIVNWYVVNTILKMNYYQYRTFTRNWINSPGKQNARQIMSTNSRTIKLGGQSCNQDFVYFFSFFILYIFICYFIFKLL